MKKDFIRRVLLKNIIILKTITAISIIIIGYFLSISKNRKFLHAKCVSIITLAKRELS